MDGGFIVGESARGASAGMSILSSRSALEQSFIPLSSLCSVFCGSPPSSSGRRLQSYTHAVESIELYAQEQEEDVEDDERNEIDEEEEEEEEEEEAQLDESCEADEG
ncbi:hypothetical protein SprV_0501992600 [Sparganum proliferum]